MQKNFDGWNTKKKNIHYQDSPRFYREREVWWCSLGVNIGSEQDGTGANFDRPFVIIKGFNKDTLWGVALTGKNRTGKYYFYLGKIEGREATVILSQIRIIDSRRLVRRLVVLDKDVFGNLVTALQKILFPK